MLTLGRSAITVLSPAQHLQNQSATLHAGLTRLGANGKPTDTLKNSDCREIMEDAAYGTFHHH
eukprot:2611830-Pyramimonas_sp.AAC.1